jgi:hypothetical protein
VQTGISQAACRNVRVTIFERRLEWSVLPDLQKSVADEILVKWWSNARFVNPLLGASHPLMMLIVAIK